MHSSASTLTALFTDLERSASLWELAPAAMAEAQERQEAVQRSVVEQYDGQVFKTTGDGVCAVFADAAAAVAAALALQRALAAETWPTPRPLRARVAIHTGTLERRDGDFFGRALNRVSRLLAAAHGGQVLLSQTAANLVQDALPPGVALRDLGVHRLRDLERPEHIYQLLHSDLPSEFGPLHTLDARVHNLPIQLTTLVGREADLAACHDLLARSRLLTLTGTGGCGKTRLGLQLAAEVTDEYPDGVWLIELATLFDPRLIPQSIAAGAKLTERLNQSDDPLGGLVAALEPKRLLLLLDNCEHMVEACGHVAQGVLARCAGVRILATSREPLGVGGEQVYQVPPLPLPREADDAVAANASPAIQLFTDRSRLSRPDFAVTQQNLEDVTRICRRLDGIPLALELAAARMRTMPLKLLSNRLDSALGLLAPAPHTGNSHHRTLEAMVDWSYELLSEEERRLFVRLGVFAGGWTLEAAESVCSGASGVPRNAVLGLLSALVLKSLVSVDEVEGTIRYRMLEVVRQFALAKLREQGGGAETEVRRRHLLHHLRLARHCERRLSGPEQGACLGRLAGEHDNVRTALEFALGEGADPRNALRLATAMGQFWWIRGFKREGREWLERAVQRVGESTSPLHARGANAAGALAWACRDLPSARLWYERSLQTWRMLGSQRREAAVLSNLAVVVAEQDPRAGMLLHQASMNLYQAIGDTTGAARAALNLGVLEVLCGKLDESLQHFETARQTFEATGDAHRLAVALENIGEIKYRQGNYEASALAFSQSLPVRASLENHEGIALMVVWLGMLRLQLGDPGSAAELLGWAEVQRTRLGLALPPFVKSEYEEVVSRCRELLGADCEARWNRGGGLDRGAAVQRAISGAVAGKSRRPVGVGQSGANRGGQAGGEIKCFVGNSLGYMAPYACWGG